MVTYVSGNLFESPAQTLVNTVNTVGVMGKGIALTFKSVYPEMFKRYVELCETGELDIGRLFLYRTPNKLILNFPTKKNWRNPSKLEYIEAGLQTFVRMYQEAGIHSIAFPPLGCGNGELDFKDVRSVMERYLSEVNIPVFIYAPMRRVAPPEHRIPATIRNWLRSEPRNLAFTEVWEDLVELVGRKRKFHTPSGNAELKAIFVPDTQEIRIQSTAKAATFQKDEVRQLWKELRSSGVLTASSVTKKREKEFGFLAGVLAELPYVETIQIADNYGLFTRSPSWALQIVPTDERRDDVPDQIELTV